jgi:ABC-type oligopeptide transport system substrate-binding subunit
MKRILAIVLLLAAACLLAASSGCASSRGSDGGYYRRGTAHQDAFPPDYVPGHYRGYRYGRHGW